MRLRRNDAVSSAPGRTVVNRRGEHPQPVRSCCVDTVSVDVEPERQNGRSLSTRTPSGPRGFAYQPALDGVRAIAVAMVLLFHAGFGWMSGGYAGVSVFFTLSGYLITSLALVEHERAGRIGVAAFYSRRIRRLMPASLICLGAVIVAAWLDQFSGVTRLRRDLWAALLQVYNWVVLASGDSYSEQVSRAAGQRAPLDHYWSLAIEEQFYWMWPVALLVILRLTPRGRLSAVVALTGAAVIATVVISQVFGADATYFATPARLPEILVGAVVAVALHRGPLVTLVLSHGTAVLAIAGLAVIAWVGAAWPPTGGPAYHGWLPAFAVASAAVIVGLQAASPVRRVMSLAPLVILGRISYGVYLYHWPVYTLVDERRFDIGRAPLFAVRAAITLAVAARVVRARRAPDPHQALRLASHLRSRRGGLLFGCGRGGGRAGPFRELHVRRAGDPFGGGDPEARPRRVALAADGQSGRGRRRSFERAVPSGPRDDHR